MIIGWMSMHVFIHIYLSWLTWEEMFKTVFSKMKKSNLYLGWSVRRFKITPLWFLLLISLIYIHFFQICRCRIAVLSFFKAIVLFHAHTSLLLSLRKSKSTRLSYKFSLLQIKKEISSLSTRISRSISSVT